MQNSLLKLLASGLCFELENGRVKKYLAMILSFKISKRTCNELAMDSSDSL